MGYLREWLAVAATVATIGYLNMPQREASVGSSAHLAKHDEATPHATLTGGLLDAKMQRAERLHPAIHLVNGERQLVCAGPWYELASSNLHVQRCEFVSGLDRSRHRGGK